MVLCAFALFVPMAFGLVACDSTSSGNSGGQLNSGDELTNDRRLLWGSIVAGIDYLNTDSNYDAKNIAVSLLSTSAGIVTTATDDNKFEDDFEGLKFKRAISISYINNDAQTSTEVYDVYYTINDGSPVYSALTGYEKNKTYIYEGKVNAGTTIYNFNAERKVDGNGKVKSESTIEITKNGDENKSFKVTGTYATDLIFADGKGESTKLAEIKIGSVANGIEKIVIGANTYKDVSVANSTFNEGKTELTYTFCYKDSGSDTTIQDLKLTVDAKSQS